MSVDILGYDFNLFTFQRVKSCSCFCSQRRLQFVEKVFGCTMFTAILKPGTEGGVLRSVI
jgi:hypothetical protein